jgi:hypothetical protein
MPERAPQGCGARPLKHGFDGLAAGGPEECAKLNGERFAHRIAAEEVPGNAYDNEKEGP